MLNIFLKIFDITENIDPFTFKSQRSLRSLRSIRSLRSLQSFMKCPDFLHLKHRLDALHISLFNIIISDSGRDICVYDPPRTLLIPYFAMYILVYLSSSNSSASEINSIILICLYFFVHSLPLLLKCSSIRSEIGRYVFPT